MWIHKWKKNNWKLFDGGQVKNKDDLIALDEALEGITVKWVCASLVTLILKLVKCFVMEENVLSNPPPSQ